ncbi:MAG: CBS domain-containing protein [Rhodospirillaceae bacterium]|nr:CBS domain-containing protein [Rhodospirillales bacterium]
MTCQSIISPAPTVLDPSDTVAKAATALLAQSYATLPVVDGQGRFVGIFGARELIGLLLPRAVRLGNDLGDLGFVSDGITDLSARLAAQSGETVGKHMAPHQTVRPETSLVEALLLLYRGDAFLPVIEDSGKLVGIVTAVDALARISGASE